MNERDIVDTIQPLLPGRTYAAAYGTTDPRAWASEQCPHCGARHLLVVTRSVVWPQGQTSPSLDEEGPRWFLCPACRKASVWQDGRVQPGSRPLRTPGGLPADDAAVWEEIRSCLGIGAYTATVMLCRKLLLHVAVEKGLPKKDARNRAPGYMEAVKHLQQVGVITAGMRSWIDSIKDIGNEANHEVAPTSGEQARSVATCTEQLLILAYEMEALQQRLALPEATEAESGADEVRDAPIEG